MFSLKQDIENSSLARLIKELKELPGIGQRNATRLAFYILRSRGDYAERLAGAIRDVKARVRLCSVCMNLTEADPCEICRDSRRDSGLICVVEDIPDLNAIERTGRFRGRYHILHGAIAPLDGIGESDIKLRELVERVRAGGIDEVIIATSATVEGETTALLVMQRLMSAGVAVSRIASGVPLGSDIDTVDVSTLTQALDQRRRLVSGGA